MPVTTLNNVTNASAVIEAIVDHLVGTGSPRTGGEGWIINRLSGSVGSDNVQARLELPNTDTFLGDYLHWCMLSIGGGTSSLNPISQISSTPRRIEHFLGNPELTAVEAGIVLGGGGSPLQENIFARILGAPNVGGATPQDINDVTGQTDNVFKGQLKTGNTNGFGAFAYDFDTSGSATQGPFDNVWIITPPLDSPIDSPQSPRYCYVVVEGTEGVFTTFGMGEGIMLGGASGGQFFDGTVKISGDLSDRRNYFLGGGISTNVFTGNESSGFVWHPDSFRHDGSPRIWNPWCFLGQYNTYVSPAGAAPSIGFDNRVYGSDYINHSPAAFSGASPRMPARFYVASDDGGGGSTGMKPLFEAPDVFHLNIANLTPGEVFTDDQGDKFLTVPYRAKTGVVSTGNLGFVIRNPDL